MLRYRLPVLVALLFFGLIGLVTTVMAALPTPPNADPLDSYDVLMPGNMIDSLSAYDCTISMVYARDSMFYCRFEPDEGPVRILNLSGEAQEISGLWLNLRGIPMVYLVRRWGWPTSITHAGQVHFVRWGNRIYAIVYDKNWLTIDSMVHFLSVYK
jgi:hypothetical protein